MSIISEVAAMHVGISINEKLSYKIILLTNKSVTKVVVIPTITNLLVFEIQSSNVNKMTVFEE